MTIPSRRAATGAPARRRLQLAVSHHRQDGARIARAGLRRLGCSIRPQSRPRERIFPRDLAGARAVSPGITALPSTLAVVYKLARTAMTTCWNRRGVAVVRAGDARIALSCTHRTLKETAMSAKQHSNYINGAVGCRARPGPRTSIPPT